MDSGFRKIISAGSDGKVKIFDDWEDSSPLEHVVGEKINYVVCRVIRNSTKQIFSLTQLLLPQMVHMFTCFKWRMVYQMASQQGLLQK